MPVVVASRALEPGTELVAGDLEVQRWPATLVPDGALDHEPLGRRLVTGLTRGEPLVGARLAPNGTGATAALLEEGSAAVSVPLGTAAPGLQVGDRVDVLAQVAASNPWDPPDAGPGVEVVADRAEVVAVDGDHATIVVSRDELERTAAAILDGAITIAVTH